MGPKKFTVDELSASLNEKLANFRVSLINDIKKEIMDEVSKLLGSKEEKIIELESNVAMLQKHVDNLKRFQETQSVQIDDVEQYGRRLCLRIDGVDKVENEKADEVLVKVKAIIEDSETEIPEHVIDRAHRIGKPYEDRDSKLMKQSKIVRFSHFRYRTMFYRNRKKLGGSLKVKLDLTKRRYKLLAQARVLIEHVPHVDYVYADINCRLKIRFKDKSEEFFTDIENLSVSLRSE